MVIMAMCACGLWLHHKISIYKEQQRRWAITPSWDSLEFALKAIRKFSDKYYPEGQPRFWWKARSFSLISTLLIPSQKCQSQVWKCRSDAT